VAYLRGLWAPPKDRREIGRLRVFLLVPRSSVSRARIAIASAVTNETWRSRVAVLFSEQRLLIEPLGPINGRMEPVHLFMATVDYGYREETLALSSETLSEGLACEGFS